MSTFFVTYGMGTNLKNCYSAIEAESYEDARAIAHQEIQNKYAFMYTEEAFAGQAEEYQLKLVPL